MIELPIEQVNHLLADAANEKIERLEDAMMLVEEKVDIPVKSLFINGMYAREILIPKGTLLTGRVHKEEYVDIMLSGDISVATPDGVKRYTGVNILHGRAGRKRAGYAHEDTRWITVHRTEIKDADEFVNTMTFARLIDYQKLIGVDQCQ